MIDTQFRPFILILSNMFFFAFWRYRDPHILKYGSTLLLAYYAYLGNQYIEAVELGLFALGDFVIEKYQIEHSIYPFMLSKWYRLYHMDAKIPLSILFTAGFFYNSVLNREIIGLYILTHIVQLIHVGIFSRFQFILSCILFSISDGIIALELIDKKYKYLEIVSYPLYWGANLLMVL